MSREKFEKYLKVLGLEAGVSLKEIKSAYKKMVLKHHPDRQTDPIAKKSANEKLKKINEAREFLLENYKYYGKYFRKERTKKTSSNKSSQKYSNQENQNTSKNNNDSTTQSKPNFNEEKGIINESLYIRPNELEFRAKVFIAVYIILFVIMCRVLDNNNNYTWQEPSLKEVTTQTQPQDNSEYVENIDKEADDEENEDEVVEDDSFFYDEILTKEESDLIGKNIKPPQKELTQGERNAKFEHEMSIAFDKFINYFGEYYKYPQLKDRTFTYNLSCYLNNSMYKSEYISGDFESEYEGVNLGRDFDSFMMSLPIHFRDDYNSNYDMRYKIQLTHTPKGTTVKLLKVCHYLEGD